MARQPNMFGMALVTLSGRGGIHPQLPTCGVSRDTEFPWDATAPSSSLEEHLRCQLLSLP
jgi:hypothetical protein